MDYDYDRVGLLAKLKLLAPAIAKPKAAAVAQIFQNLWFTPYGMLACNDVIGMATTLDNGPLGGVHGARLIGLLENSSASRVTLSTDGNGRLHVAAGFKAELLTDTDEPPFTWPQADEDADPVTVDDDVAAVLRLACDIINPRALHRQARGLNLVRDDGGLVLYATDRNSLLRASFEQPGEMLQAILSLPFTEQLAKLAAGSLVLQDDYALFDSERAGVWGRLLQPEDEAIDFEQTFAEKRAETATPLPPGFWEAVSRCGVMAVDASKPKVIVSMRLTGDEMQLAASGGGGAVSDALPFAHTPCEVRFNQPLVERMAKRSGLTHLGVNRQALTFSDDDGVLEYMIGSH